MAKGVSLLFRDQTNAPGSAEIDILLFNERPRLGFSFLPEYLMFECKNWSDPVNSATVDSFITKVRSARLELGILVAANGVTGDPAERTAANDVIRRAFDRDGIKILVVTRTEIESFRSVREIVVMMRRKFGGLIMRLAVL
jgi:hypothetical protein